MLSSICLGKERNDSSAKLLERVFTLEAAILTQYSVQWNLDITKSSV